MSGRHNSRQLGTAWKKILNGYLAEFGLSNDYKEYLKLKAQSVELWHDVYIKGQRYKEIFAKLKDEQAKGLIAKKERQDGELISFISKQMGFRIDLKQVSTYEFYSYLKAIHGGRKNII